MKAVYFIVASGIEISDALGTPAHLVGPVAHRSEAMKLASELLASDDTGTYDVVKAHFTVVDTFTIAPVVVASFLRS